MCLIELRNSSSWYISTIAEPTFYSSNSRTLLSSTSSSSTDGFFLTFYTRLLTYYGQILNSFATCFCGISLMRTLWAICIFSDNVSFFFVLHFFRWLIGGFSVNSDILILLSSVGLPEPLLSIF